MPGQSVDEFLAAVMCGGRRPAGLQAETAEMAETEASSNG
jgi:hypothetical protein